MMLFMTMLCMTYGSYIATVTYSHSIYVSLQSVWQPARFSYVSHSTWVPAWRLFPITFRIWSWL